MELRARHVLPRADPAFWRELPESGSAILSCLKRLIKKGDAMRIMKTLTLISLLMVGFAFAVEPAAAVCSGGSCVCVGHGGWTVC